MIQILDGGHGGLFTRANGARLPLSESAGRVGLIELGPFLVDASDEEAYTVGAGHGLALGAGIPFSEVDSDVGDRLGNSLDVHGFSIVEGVVLRFNATVVDEDSGVTDDAGHGAGAVAVDFDELFRLAGLDHEDSGGKFLLNAENNTLIGLNTNGSGTVLEAARLTKKIGDLP